MAASGAEAAPAGLPGNIGLPTPLSTVALEVAAHWGASRGRPEASALGDAPGSTSVNSNAGVASRALSGGSDAEGQPETKRQRQVDSAWSQEWAEVFAKMQEGHIEARAGEYAEAVVALKKNAESLMRERATVRASCEQLLQTAYREAMQAHIKAMREAVSAGATQEMLDAARRIVDDLATPSVRRVAEATSTGPEPSPSASAVISQPSALPAGVVVPPAAMTVGSVAAQGLQSLQALQGLQGLEALQAMAAADPSSSAGQVAPMQPALPAAVVAAAAAAPLSVGAGS